MRISTRVVALSGWLALSLSGTALVLSRSVSDAHDRFFQDTSIAIRVLGQKAAQQEAILATLGATPLRAVPPHMLDDLRERMPQLTGLARWRPGIGWHSVNGAAPGMPPPLNTAAKPYALEFEADGRYWLVAATGWAVRIDPRTMLQPGDWPASLTSVTLQLQGRRFEVLNRPPAAAPLGWPMTLDKRLPTQPQALTLHATRTLTVDDLPWLPIALWNTVAILLVAGVLGAWRLRDAQRREHARARLDRFGRLDTLGEMAAGIAHELNQPLMAIVTHTRAAERLLDLPAERDNVRRALQTSVAQAKRAASILDRLRVAATSAHGGERRALDPDAIVSALQLLYRDELARAQISLGWHNATPGARPFADPVAVEQILHNLIQNARDALSGAPHGTIRVSGERTGRHYRFSVIDDGPGIPPDTLPRLFEPFFTTRGHGLGLGLPLCDTLAQRQNGALEIHNRPSGGVEAILSLPLAEVRP
ncbi:sensor histidine kinase [Burkholderia sp. MSMB1835]|uniref:sensor histidine kinase n=1 Tax=Burkholderia sp. MSMB1835 TaxID=1637876 RepID=UPI00075A1C85|nr:ATP-binding protein [Burkholderia sp. MSMB1835]KVL37854.1 ATPase [Burkholderia sp. MSMB1835]